MSANPLPDKAASAPEPVLRALVLCDLADSTALVERLGDSRAAEVLRRHDRTARLLMHRHGGQEIDKTDGFLVLFDRPIHAIAFALDYHQSLRDLSVSEGETLRARVGVHVGDVVVWSNSPDDVAQGAKPFEVEGLAKPVAARLMGLAVPGQTLASATTAELAKRSEQALRERFPDLQWRSHGLYAFKGVPEPAAVYEVAADTRAPLLRPPNSQKAKRHLAWWRRPIVLAGEIAAIAAIAVAVGLLTLQPKPAIAFAERDWIVVGNLRNLTGDEVFDASLEAAFRISLEQSQFVNVIPELQVRDALTRMKREPGTIIDRAVASEIALRDGARAVVLPTVAEVGGRLRVSAEVIDPNTQTTVYAESADGEGTDSVLPSIDTVARTLRGKLGESLAAIDRTSEPLEKVATSNLDALRTYGLALKAHANGRFADADQLLLHAVELDPTFASAWLRLAAGWNTADRVKAYTYVQQAVPFRDRLMPRDQLHLDAYVAMFQSPEASLQKWRLMAEVYPKFYVGQQNSGLYGWQWENDFAGAIPMLQAVAESQHPLRAMSFDLLGHMRLGTGDSDGSLRAYETANQLGLATLDFGRSATHLARREYDAALADASDVPPQLPSFFKLYAPFRRAMVELDRGRLPQATAELEQATADAERQGLKKEARRFRAMQLQVASASAGGASAAAIDSFVETETQALASDSPLYGSSHAFNLLVAAILQARGGESDAANETIAKVAPMVHAGEYPVLENVLAVARAEVALAKGDGTEAARLVRPWLEHRPVYLTHSVLLHAAAARGDLESARSEAKWLADHRGAALAEWSDGYLLQPLNLLDCNAATLSVAEVAVAAKRRPDAEAALAELPAEWPRSDAQLATTRRVAALREAVKSLDEGPHP